MSLKATLECWCTRCRKPVVFSGAELIPEPIVCDECALVDATARRLLGKTQDPIFETNVSIRKGYLLDWYNR